MFLLFCLPHKALGLFAKKAALTKTDSATNTVAQTVIFLLLSKIFLFHVQPPSPCAAQTPHRAPPGMLTGTGRHHTQAGNHFSSIFFHPPPFFPFRTRPIPVSMHKNTFQSCTVASCEMHPGSLTCASRTVICWQVPDLAADEPRKLQQHFEVMQPQLFWASCFIWKKPKQIIKKKKSNKGVQGFVESRCLIKVSPAESCTTMESCNNPKWWHQHISRQGPRS